MYIGIYIYIPGLERNDRRMMRLLFTVTCAALIGTLSPSVKGIIVAVFMDTQSPMIAPEVARAMSHQQRERQGNLEAKV
jgi:hypothetical protein